MLVHRLTLYVKPASRTKAVEMLREAKKTIVPPPHGSLIYTNHTGEYCVLIHDFKFENLSEFEEYWDKVYSHPDYSAWHERWIELLQERAGKNEILSLYPDE